MWEDNMDFFTEGSIIIDCGLVFYIPYFYIPYHIYKSLIKNAQGDICMENWI